MTIIIQSYCPPTFGQQMFIEVLLGPEVAVRIHEKQPEEVTCVYSGDGIGGVEGGRQVLPRNSNRSSPLRIGY